MENKSHTNFISKSYKSIKQIIKKKHISQPSFSISFDYYIFAVGIILTALLSGSWYIWHERKTQSENLKHQLATEARIIDSKLSNYLNYVAYIIEDRAHKIAEKGADDLSNIHFLLKHSFVIQKHKSGLSRKMFRWPSILWVDTKNHIIVDSRKGIMDSTKAINGAEGDYLFHAKQKPWQLHLSEPYYDIKRDDMFLNAAMGVFDKKNQFVGSMVTYFEIDKIIKTIESAIDPKLSFVILNRNMLPIMQSSNNIPLSRKLQDRTIFQENLKGAENTIKQTEGAYFFAKPILFRTNVYLVSHQASEYPYTILMGYNSAMVENGFISQISQKVLFLSGTTFLILLILLIFHKRIIRPITHLASVAKRIGKGEHSIEVREHRKRYYSPEIHHLRKGVLMTQRQIKRIKRASEELSLKNMELAQSKHELEETKERLEYQQEIADKSKRDKEVLLSKVRHAVKEPLNSALAYAQLLLSREKGDESSEMTNISISNEMAAGYLENIMDSITQALTYTNSEMILTHVKVVPLVEHCISVNASDAIKRNITIESHIPEEITPLYSSQLNLERLIASLIYWGVEDTRNGGKVVITAKEEKTVNSHRLVIVIDDNGRGHSEEERKEIRTQCGQNEDGDEEIRLSMQTMQYIVSLHQGSLIDNYEWNVGTTITVKLPYRNEKEADILPKLKAEGVTYIDFKNKKRME